MPKPAASVLADTSVWIEYLNRQKTAAGDMLQDLLEQHRVVTCGLVIAELLQGALTTQEADIITDTFEALYYLDVHPSTWVKAGNIAFALRRKGITVPLSDCMLSALALEAGCEIFSVDAHFRKIPGLTLYGGSKATR